jgi:hypothetical protein
MDRGTSLSSHEAGRVYRTKGTLNRTSAQNNERKIEKRCERDFVVRLATVSVRQVRR